MTKAISDRLVVISIAHRPVGVPLIDYLMRETGQTREQCYKAIDRAIEHGLVYSGVSANYPWLTADGHQLLKNHRRDDDDVSRPVTADS